MKRKLDFEEEYLSSSSEEEELAVPTLEFSWKQRNQYVKCQLEIIEKLVNASHKVSDSAFSMKLEVKAHNMYTQIESLLELESMTDVVKTCPIQQDEKQVTITDCIVARDGFVEDYDLKQVGKRASTLYQRVYGRRPRKSVRYFDGEPVAVNVYTKSSSERTIEVALDELE